MRLHDRARLGPSTPPILACKTAALSLKSGKDLKVNNFIRPLCVCVSVAGDGRFRRHAAGPSLGSSRDGKTIAHV